MLGLTSVHLSPSDARTVVSNGDGRSGSLREKPRTDDSEPVASKDYWQRIFRNNPRFSSWQHAKQRAVKREILKSLGGSRDPLRVLDFGIGNLGLYHCFDHALLDRLELTGISESEQHDPNDELLTRYRIDVITGEGVSPLEAIRSESMDVVISTYVLAYLNGATRARLLEELGRVLAPNGELVLVLHHPAGRRNRAFKRSYRYWISARQLYLQLLDGRWANARQTLAGLAHLLSEHFPDDVQHRRYLASYIRTGARFVEMFCRSAKEASAIPEQAFIDCEETVRLIDREFAMTCQSFNPIHDPIGDLVLPASLRVARLTECRDPTDNTPIANVFRACKDDR